ncbi:hypothetical protein NN561_003825 [Cricetulus griseus]
MELLLSTQVPSLRECLPVCEAQDPAEQLRNRRPPGEPPLAPYSAQPKRCRRQAPTSAAGFQIAWGRKEGSQDLSPPLPTTSWPAKAHSPASSHRWNLGAQTPVTELLSTH